MSVPRRRLGRRDGASWPALSGNVPDTPEAAHRAPPPKAWLTGVVPAHRWELLCAMLRDVTRLKESAMLRNSFCLAVLVLLAVAPTRSQEGFSLFTTDFPPEEFAARRAAIYKAIGPNGLALVQGAPAPAGLHPIPSVERVLLPDRHRSAARVHAAGRRASRATLYLPHRNERREASRARCSRPRTPTRSASSLASMRSAGTELLGEHLARAARAGRRVALHADESRRRRCDEPRPGACARSAIAPRIRSTARPRAKARFVRALRARFPQFEVRDLSPDARRAASDQEPAGARR